MRLTFRSIPAVAAAGLALALAAGCGNDGPSSPGFGTMRVQMTDAPGSFDEVNLVVTEVSVRREFAVSDSDSVDDAGDWIVLSDGPHTYDLMDLQNGVFTTIGVADLPAGAYSQIRMKLGTGSTVVVDGVSHPLVVPSGAQSGLKLIGDFDVAAGGTTDIGLDFDAGRSVHQTGNGTWMLKPVVRVMPISSGGSITGRVVPDSTEAMVWLLTPPDSVGSTSVEIDGDFRFSLVPAGTYAVRVEPDSGYRDTTIAGVVVSNGSTTDLGTIGLTATAP
jgi:hypothetical protein